MNIRWAEFGDYEAVQLFYRECGYGGGVNDSDRVAIAVENEIIAAVRICFEQGFKVLRGMQVAAAYQSQGLGSAILQFLDQNLGLYDCYCLPYAHLALFYGQVGFKEILPAQAPVFLAERLGNYAVRSDTPIIIMKTNSHA